MKDTIFYRSVNEVICHGIPDTRPLKDGDILNIDITVYKVGWRMVLLIDTVPGTHISLETS